MFVKEIGYGHQFVEGVTITYFYEPEVGKSRTASAYILVMEEALVT